MTELWFMQAVPIVGGIVCGNTGDLNTAQNIASNKKKHKDRRRVPFVQLISAPTPPPQQARFS